MKITIYLQRLLQKFCSLAVFLHKALLIFLSLIYLDAEEKKSSFNIDFYGEEKFVYEADSTQLSQLYLGSEIFLKFAVPVSFYKFEIYTSEYLVSDFKSLIDDINLSVTDSTLISQGVFYNAWRIGNNNRFRIEDKIDINLDFNFEVNTPFDYETFLTIEPIVKLKGDYYTGFFWNANAFLTGEYYTESNIYQFIPEFTIIGGYEFFRTYGPTDFKFGLESTETFNPYVYNDGTFYLSTNMTHGIYIYYKDFYHYANFSYDISYDSLYDKVYLEPGISTGIEYSFKYLTISFDYTGILLDTSGWSNTITTYIRVYYKN